MSAPTESTSAALRRVEQELADARASNRIVADEYVRICAIAHLREAELASATTELAHWRGSRSWSVARQPSGYCSACDGPIVRGQAVEPLPAAKGYFIHVVCPDRETPR